VVRISGATIASRNNGKYIELARDFSYLVPEIADRIRIILRKDLIKGKIPNPRIGKMACDLAQVVD